MELAKRCRRRNSICVLAAVNIKNAFTTLSWNKILLEAEAKGMPRKLLTFLVNYLENRKIIVQNTGVTVKGNVFAGVTEGSILTFIGKHRNKIVDPVVKSASWRSLYYGKEREEPSEHKK
jgi:hypothetical protein